MHILWQKRQLYMIKKLYILFLMCLFFSGCASYSTHDIPDVDFDVSSVQIPKDERHDMTFSISFRQEVSAKENGEITLTNRQDYLDKVREYFKKSGLFRKVHYVSPDQAGDLHYHFDIMMTGTSPQTQWALVSPLMIPFVNLVWMCCPYWFNYNVDIVMTVVKKGKIVYSVTAPQKVKDVFWIGFILAWPIYNRGIIGNNVENRSLDYFLKEIAINKLY